MKTALIIPVRNAERHVDRLVRALKIQTDQPDEWLVIDSQSEDQSAKKFSQAGAKIFSVKKEQFNHGGTRHWISEQTNADILIYMTQDAIFANEHSLSTLKAALVKNPELGLVYGRQLPHQDADVLASHARHFNYPGVSRTKTLADANELGIKACFNSDVFCAYRREALKSVGGFPKKVIGSEDAYVAAKMLLEGWSIRYEASAKVFHSHNYSLLEEFRRYFDIGVFYGREKWLVENFGKAEGEGKKFVLSEMNAIKREKQIWRAPEVLLRSALKLTGYRLGHLENHLPIELKRKLSMFSIYWNQIGAK